MIVIVVCVLCVSVTLIRSPPRKQAKKVVLRKVSVCQLCWDCDAVLCLCCVCHVCIYVVCVSLFLITTKKTSKKGPLTENQPVFYAVFHVTRDLDFESSTTRMPFSAWIHVHERVAKFNCPGISL